LKNFKEEPALSLAAEIRKRVKGKTAIVGIGNIMRGDDGLGPKLIEILRGMAPRAALFDCGTAPENYIFPILSSSCETVIFVDAADFDGAAGSIRIFEVSETSKVSFSTHSPSPRLFIDLLNTGRDNLNIFIVSIQPKTTDLGAPLSSEVERSIKLLAGVFLKALS
jgi:hydrogenase 3 maturation protease